MQNYVHGDRRHAVCILHRSRWFNGLPCRGVRASSVRPFIASTHEGSGFVSQICPTILGGSSGSGSFILSSPCLPIQEGSVESEALESGPPARHTLQTVPRRIGPGRRVCPVSPDCPFADRKHYHCSCAQSGPWFKVDRASAHVVRARGIITSLALGSIRLTSLLHV